MNEWFEGPERPDTGPPAPRPLPDSLDWDRLEEVGDLHFQASSFSSALDYYRRLLGQDHLRTIAPERALDILRKCTITALKIGNLRLAAEFLDQTPAVLEAETPLDPEERKRLMAPLIGCRASLHFARGDYARALQLAKHAFAILAVTDRHQEVAMLQITMGVSHGRLGRPEKAEEFYTDALATFRRIGDELGMAVLYNNLALLAKNACRWDRALELMEKAKSLARKHGATHLLSRLHLNEGIILVKLGRLAEGRTALETCLRLARSLGDRARQTKASLGLGRLEILEGRLARAEELILAGKVQAEQEHFLREAAIADEYLGDILLARGEIDKALFNYGLGLEKSRTIGQVNDLEGELLRRTAEAQRQRGELDLAVETAQASIAVCEKCGELYELGFCHLTLGRAHASRSRWQEADAHLRQAVATFRKQNLVQDWCRAILEYFRIRLETAGQRELLILRRYLLAAQEQAAPAVSETLLLEVLAALAEVQLRLGQFDDALLTAYELERVTRDAKDEDLAGSVASLRGRIERGMMGDLEEKGHHLRTISGISGLFGAGDRSITRNLSSVLQAGLEKVRADCGFIAMEGRGEDGGWAIVAREQLSENLAEQLTRWFAGQQDSAEPSGSCLFSRLSAGDPLLEAVPALKGHARSCVFMPIAMEGRRFGLLFLGKVEVHGFGRPALDFLSTYMGFLGLFLHEKGKARPFPTAEHIPTPIEGVASFENIITRNEMMLEVLGLIRKVAPSDLTTLLKGETGTGKGLLAYAIHALSRRRERKFLAINCAAIPETLLESELFGHKKGSFTGAHEDKRGLLAEAEGGTVFLDEIGKMPLSMQGKLLHFLDTKIVRPVGSLREQRVDVRIICASKTDLQELARQGLFLEDLYYRLLDFPLEIPPLRERRDDIPLLIQHFVERFSQELGVDAPACGSAFMDALVQHDWPGNVRELEKALKRAIVLAQGENLLRPEHLPADLVGYDPGRASGDEIPPLKETLAAVECREISQVLKCTRGNKSKAARLLGISYPSLLKKIRFYGIRTR